MSESHTIDMTVCNENKHRFSNEVPLVASRSLQDFPEPPIYTGTGEESYLYFHIEPKDTNYVNRILEGYEYVGVMTTIDPAGRCMLRCTPDTRELAIHILSSLSVVTLEK